MDTNALKVFTLEEANQMIPVLRKLIGKLRRVRNLILNQEAEIDAFELICEKDEKGESPALAAKVKLYNDSINDFYATLEEMTHLGCHLKNLDIGLIDFYSFYEGRLIYLCWKTNEEKITHWHEIGKGYDSRQPYQAPSESK